MICIVIVIKILNKKVIYYNNKYCNYKTTIFVSIFLFFKH